MRIGNRLGAGLALMPDCEILADIGCDHGKLSAAALQSGKAKRVIASDISRPSLDKAYRLAKKLGFQGRMQCRIGDGLAVLERGEADAAVLAGMGGELIASLLETQESIARSLICLVLQPMQNATNLRRFLRKNDWCIEDEKLAYERGQTFAWMRVSPGLERPPRDIPLHLVDELGPRNWERRDPLLIPILKQKCMQLTRQAAYAMGGETERSQIAAEQKHARRNELEAILEMLKEAEDRRYS